VCAAFGDDARTLDVVRRMLADGTAWTSGSVWHDRAVLRISVSNWSTTDADVARTLDALRAAAGADRSSQGGGMAVTDTGFRETGGPDVG